jgi:hypothetical protein
VLKNLFISKVRIKVLEQFMFNPNEGYHVRGLVRIMNEEINAIRRELINLKDTGILKSENLGNKVVYRLNPDCPIIPELTSMLYKDSQLGQQLYKIGSKVVNAQMVIICNPYIINKYENSLDVDVLFIGDIDIKKLAPEIKDLERSTEREIRYSVISQKDFEFGKKKRDPFLMNILDKENIVLLGSVKALAV